MLCISFSVTLTTGGSTSVNNSYIEVGASTNLNVGDNLYTICPCSDDICRIKFDFEVINFYLKSIIINQTVLYKYISIL